jgi:hypothetical protein
VLKRRGFVANRLSHQLVAMVVVVVVMMPVTPVVMVVVVMMMGLCELYCGLRRGRRRAFVNYFQRRCCIRDRLQQLGIGIGLQDVRRLGGRGRRGLGRAQGANRGHRSKKSSYSLFHGVSLQCAVARERNVE